MRFFFKEITFWQAAFLFTVKLCQPYLKGHKTQVRVRAVPIYLGCRMVKTAFSGHVMQQQRQSWPELITMLML